MGLEAKIMFLDQLEGKLCPKSVIFGKFGGHFEKSCEAFMKMTFFEKTQNRTWPLNCIGTKKNDEPIENSEKFCFLKSMTQPTALTFFYSTIHVYISVV